MAQKRSAVESICHYDVDGPQSLDVLWWVACEGDRAQRVREALVPASDAEVAVGRKKLVPL